MNEQIFQPRRAIAIAKKEFAHVFRDRFTMGLALGLPIVIVLIFGIAIEFNQTNIPTAILDQDRSQSSRQFIETLSSSGYFEVVSIQRFSEVQKQLESESSKTAIIIPPKLESDLVSGRGAEIQVLVNAADNQAAGSILSYLGDIQQRTNKKLVGSAPQNIPALQSRFLFNPELNSKWFTVPGLLVVIMSMLAILLTALTVAREWEFGSMELLLSTPVKPLEIIVGKMTPYAVLCMSAVLITYFCARVFFGVPFAGSYIAFFVGCILFLVTYLAQGLMISVITRKQMLAMQISMMTGLLPSMLLSGFIFPLENMPIFFRGLTMVLPAKWFMEISRGSFLQGASFWQMRDAFFALSLQMFFFVFIALKNFKKDVEP
jgi:ABC-2 type transport system permease protein